MSFSVIAFVQEEIKRANLMSIAVATTSIAMASAAVIKGAETMSGDWMLEGGSREVTCQSLRPKRKTRTDKRKNDRDSVSLLEREFVLFLVVKEVCGLRSGVLFPRCRSWLPLRGGRAGADVLLWCCCIRVMDCEGEEEEDDF